MDINMEPEIETAPPVTGNADDEARVAGVTDIEEEENNQNDHAVIDNTPPDPKNTATAAKTPPPPRPALCIGDVIAPGTAPPPPPPLNSGLPLQQPLPLPPVPFATAQTPQRGNFMNFPLTNPVLDSRKLEQLRIKSSRLTHDNRNSTAGTFCQNFFFFSNFLLFFVCFCLFV